MYADDHDGTFQSSESVNPHWFSLKFRDTYHVQYGMPRSSFYCPSNSNWDRDDFWTVSNNEDSVFGYSYWAGNSLFNQHGSLLDDLSILEAGLPVFARNNTDAPYFRVLWTDLTRKLNGTDWMVGGDSDPLLRGVNHFNRQAEVPEGSNEGYLDGHVEWANAAKFIQRPKIRMGSHHYFYAGVEQSSDQSQ